MSTVITREPQYIPPALVSGILLHPPRAAGAAADPGPAEDGGEEGKGSMPHIQPLCTQVSLSRSSAQAGSHLQVQKNKHVKGEIDLPLHAH